MSSCSYRYKYTYKWVRFHNKERNFHNIFLVLALNILRKHEIIRYEVTRRQVSLISQFEKKLFGGTKPWSSLTPILPMFSFSCRLNKVLWKSFNPPSSNWYTLSWLIGVNGTLSAYSCRDDEPKFSARSLWRNKKGVTECTAKNNVTALKMMQYNGQHSFMLYDELLHFIFRAALCRFRFTVLSFPNEGQLSLILAFCSAAKVLLVFFCRALFKMYARKICYLFWTCKELQTLFPSYLCVPVSFTDRK